MRAMNIHHPVAGVARGDTLSERLRQARQHANVSQADAAKGANITERRLKAIEAGTGSAPAVPTIQKLAYQYGVPALWLSAGGLAGAKFVPSWYRLGGAA